MKNSFPYLHWLLTILITPFIGKIFGMVFNNSSAAFIGILEAYHITILGSLILSLPTFIIYIALFYRLRHMEVSDTKKKFILISMAILGIVVTLAIAGGNLKYTLMLIYSLTNLIIGLLLKLTKNKPKVS